VSSLSDDPNNAADVDSDSDGNPDDPTVTALTQTPELTIEKVAGTLTDSNSDGVTGGVGDDITYSFTVENTGNVSLTNVTVTDPTATVSGGPITLAVGASDNSSFTASYEITQADIDAGGVTNTATATAEGPDGNELPGVDSDTGTDTSGQVINNPLNTDSNGDGVKNNDPTVVNLSNFPTLIDQIEEPLKEILENDMRETVANQSRLFEDIARGARDRLANRSGDSCVRALNRRVEEEPILFATARADLRPESQELVDELAGILASCEDARVEIGGHTDSRGGDDYNLRLSQARVETVLRALAQQGVDSERLVARKYGEREPIADNATPEGRAQNRRVVFRVVDDIEPMPEECGQLRPFDVDGSAEAGAGLFNTNGTFGEEFYNCQTGVRQIIRGEFSLSHDEDLGTQGMLTGTLQRERMRSEDHLAGYFIGAYASRTNVTSRADGDINGYGLYGGLYGAARVEQEMYLDYYLAASAGHHTFDLRFSEGLSQAIDADGSYQYLGLFGGLSISGEAQYGETRVTPRAGLHLTYASAGDADVTASIPGRSESGQLSLEDQQGVRFFAEVGFTLGEDEVEDDTRKLTERLHLAPRMYCDMAIGSDNDTACGIGAGLEYSVTNPLYGTSWGVDLDAETSGDITRGSVGMFYERPVFDNGTLRFGSDVTRDGNANISGDLSVEW
jgi:uncharacterized repeat protein (TIGR01451 family)